MSLSVAVGQSTCLPPERRGDREGERVLPILDSVAASRA